MVDRLRLPPRERSQQLNTKGRKIGMIKEPKIALDLPVDFAVLTIIDEEREAAVRLLDLENTEWEEMNYWHGKVKSEVNAEDLTVVVVQSRDRGNIAAAVLASQVISLFEPTNLIVVGIAGGVAGRDDIALGDVVISNDLEYYELSKQENGVELPRPTVHEPPSAALLDTSDRVRLEERWSSRIQEARPIGECSEPKALRGLVLTGEKLLGDPNSPMLKALLDKHDKALAVEMESGGVARAVWENSSSWKAQFLVIRAISDYCNIEGNQEARDQWKIYAAEAAAAFALAVIQNTPAPPRDRSLFDKYKRSLLNALGSDDFSSSLKFELTFSTKNQRQLTHTKLVDVASNERRLVLRGYAGGGKSVLLRQCAKEITSPDIIPVFFDLKTYWKDDYSNELATLVRASADVHAKFDVLLKTCVTDLNRKMLENFRTEDKLLLLVDGLNEVFGQEASKNILDTLDQYVLETAPRTFVLVADRMGQRPVNAKWVYAELDLLATVEVQKQIQSRFGNEVARKLTENDSKLLRIPYYLNIGLKSESPNLGSAAQAIRGYFLNQVGINDEGLTNLSNLAFDVYVNDKSLSFDPFSFALAAGEEMWNKLQESGAVKTVENRAHFEHQLHHDYLASRHLAINKEAWTSETFDALSFDSKSTESLELALEQLSGPEEGDEFLTDLYDWNWGATVACLANAAQSGIKNYSLEMETVVLAVVAEKLFDPVSSTRARARRYFSFFAPDSVDQFSSAEKLPDIITIVRAIDSEKQWFREWKALFIQEPGINSITEQDIDRVASSNPILGWTAANVVRRFDLSGEDSRHLRAIFETSRVMGNYSVQWRVVHALGRSAIEKNAKLLFGALNSSYLWVRYGAVRSSIEMAAVANSESIRQTVIDELVSVIDQMERSVLDEMCRAVFYRGSPPSWGKLVNTLFAKVRDTQKAKADLEEFERIILDFQEFIRKERNGT